MVTRGPQQNETEGEEPERPAAAPRKALDQQLREWAKRYKDREVASLGRSRPAPTRERSGIVEFDVASGGGWPRGRVAMVHGPADTGKSSLIYKSLATYQERHPDEYVALADIEHNYDDAWGAEIGMDRERLLYMEPEYGEQAGDMVLDLIERSHELRIGMIALDSVAGLVSHKEAAKSMEDDVVAMTGLLVSRLCKLTQNRMVRVSNDGHVPPTILYVNQQRTQIGKMFGSQIALPGGKALPFWVATMVQLYGGKETVDADVHPERPSVKHVSGLITKKKGLTGATRFEAPLALIARPGTRVLESVDSWKYVSEKLKLRGRFQRHPEGGYEFAGGRFPRIRDCRDWYLAHQHEVVEELIGGARSEG